jgi:hypothetical protein
MPTFYQKACEHCSAEFQVLPRVKKQRYCSPSCVRESKRNPNKLNSCLHCSTHLSRTQMKFCSQSCAASHNNKGVRRHGKSIEERLKPCQQCGKMTDNIKFCSIECTNRGKSIPDAIRAENRKLRSRIAQRKYQAKKLRRLDSAANIDLITRVYRNCPDGFEVDHCIPLSKGGKHHEDNLQYLTVDENRSKGNRKIYSVWPRHPLIEKLVRREGFEPP